MDLLSKEERKALAAKAAAVRWGKTAPAEAGTVKPNQLKSAS